MSDTISKALSAARRSLSDANKKFPTTTPKAAPAPAPTTPAPGTPAPKMTQGEEISKSLEAKKKNISDYINEYGDTPYSTVKK